MARLIQFTGVIVATGLLALVLPALSDARGRERRPPPPQPGPGVIVSGQVFIGGYFYDPRWGPYPWWPPGAYPWYLPVYDRRAEVRVLVTPKTAAVYVDGYYAGIVDDFDGVFQGLYLPPGGHTVTLFLPGYHTATYNLYLRPGSSMRLRHVLEPTPIGAQSQPPMLAPPIPPPPAGTYEPPRTAPPVQVPAPAQPPAAVGHGTLDLRVQPAAAEVTIDGAPWVTSEPGHFAVQLARGRHVIEVASQGYRRFSTEVEIREGETTPLNVSLAPDGR